MKLQMINNYLSRANRKRAFRVCVDSDDPYQTALMRCVMTRAFAVRCQNHWIHVQQNV